MPFSYQTASGLRVEVEQISETYLNAIEPLINKLNDHRGALFASGYEYPGRYTCWDIGFFNPPLLFSCRMDLVSIEALNERGRVLLALLKPALMAVSSIKVESENDRNFYCRIIPSQAYVNEEERSRQPSVFSVLRAVIAFFKSERDPYLGLFGAFAYDLIFQFEAFQQTLERAEDQRDMVLYLPDELYIIDHRKEEAFIRRYEFISEQHSTRGLERDGLKQTYNPVNYPDKKADHEPGEYAELVVRAKKEFACGNLFEVVPSQTFYQHYPEEPSVLFRKMRSKNPSPYGFFINLGQEEYLIGASPEMYVRVQGRRIETCPISGTIKRGSNAMEDAANIETLLASEKESAELTMCTDVDRNDKSRICEAGSVEVIGRRQIEMYSRLIHTVDHVQGILREGYDAIDAFLTHMWVVTVTGAPKLWAMKFIESHEKTPRRWYAGAVGWLAFDGNLNTGLVLRTVRLHKGLAEIRAGATLLFDSEAHAEEKETELKASAFMDMLKAQDKPCVAKRLLKPAKGKKIVLIDFEDSFVHTLANYFRQTGAEVITIRHHFADAYLKKNSCDLVVFSPGPGRPEDFQTKKIIDLVLKQQIPCFGVCLGLQAMVEYFGGQLHQLDYPVHGKSSFIQITSPGGLFQGLDNPFKAGRYHSLYVKKAELPPMLSASALYDDLVMAISHKSEFIHAIQFHPETILSLHAHAGQKIIHNLMEMVCQHAR